MIAYGIFPIRLVRGYYECREIFFGEGCGFLSVLWVRFLFLIGVSEAVVWCFVVRFNMVCGAV
jgi:hypothetical protein